MLTNNFLAVLQSVFLLGQKDKCLAAKDTLGGNYGYGMENLRNQQCMKIGTGTTLPKRTDFALEEAIPESSYVATFNIITVADYTCENGLLTLQGTFTNKSDEDLSVTEFGAFGSYYSDRNYMYAREVLNTPVVIAPGETKTFNIQLF